MATAALVVAILALVVSIVSVAYTHRQTVASEQQAELAKRQDHRERRPHLSVRLHEPVSAPVDSAVYYVKNDGQHDLDSVVLHRPEVYGGILHMVARSGTDWGDSTELGPLRLGQEQAFVLSIGSAEQLPGFHVRLECHDEGEMWPVSFTLEDPRLRRQLY